MKHGFKSFCLTTGLWIIATGAQAAGINAVNTLVQKNERRLSIGIEVVSAKTGRTLYQHNATQLLVPGSTMKLFTGRAALLSLGPQFVFKTQLYADLTTHTVYIHYSGDPSLTSNGLNTLIMHLKKKNISHINHIVIDDYDYDKSAHAPGWSTSDFRFCFSAPINAIIVNHNCGATLGGAWAYNASVLRSLLQKNNITLTGDITEGPVSPHAKLIDAYHSAPLSILVKRMLKKSDNIIAASLFKKMGEINAQQPGSWQNGGIAVKAIFKTQDHLNLQSVVIVDGSGLSHDDRASAAIFVDLLQRAYITMPIDPTFYNALPISATDGTLKNRLRSLRGRVHAKTGAIKNANSLAGYVKTRRSGTLIFAIIINGSTGTSASYHKLEDKIVSALATL